MLTTLVFILRGMYVEHNMRDQESMLASYVKKNRGLINKAYLGDKRLKWRRSSIIFSARTCRGSPHWSGEIRTARVSR